MILLIFQLLIKLITKTKASITFELPYYFGMKKRHRDLLRDVLDVEMGKKSPRLEYFFQIMKDRRCGTFREVK